MALKVFNSMGRKLEEFVPIKKGQVGLYTCGPTVYQRAHIGNLRGFLFYEALVRTLHYLGYKTNRVFNITDVGHLLIEDADNQDRMELAATKESRTAREIADEYTALFLEDMQTLNMLQAEHMPRATEKIPGQLAMIKVLEEKGFTYTLSDGVYFDISKDEDYGKLAGKDLDSLRAGTRIEANPDKKNPGDFALWKFSEEGVQRQQEWDSPWGKGYPGWHIECSAMSLEYLGETFDIHTGGIDHLFPHHTNEIAQSESANGKIMANFWMHNNFLLVDGQKMSKSLGNTYTMEDIVAKSFDPLAFRYLALSAHYRSEINFTWQALESAQRSLYRLKRLFNGPVTVGKANDAAVAQFREALEDDLNMPRVFEIMWGVVRDNAVSLEDKRATLEHFDQVLGLRLNTGIVFEVPDNVRVLADQRQAYRLEKDFAKSDQ
jgi:cysteinyl-tRNA synthetase